MSTFVKSLTDLDLFRGQGRLNLSGHMLQASDWTLATCGTLWRPPNYLRDFYKGHGVHLPELLTIGKAIGFQVEHDNATLAALEAADRLSGGLA
ncbi:MAG: hypothetical protein K0R10_142 [Alphaproteobacteria bacterium]|jgi:hypothetical protein|nr:hypothetical protein [Alphaproteobacteria bacterium]